MTLNEMENMNGRALKGIFITELCFQMLDGRMIKAYIIKSKRKREVIIYQIYHLITLDMYNLNIYIPVNPDV